MGVKVVPVKTKKELNRFIKLPWKLYKDDPNWVPPLLTDIKSKLDKKKNPLFSHVDAEYFLAYKDGSLAGRITAHIDHLYNETWNEKSGFFGFFESVNDQEVASALFETVEKWHRERGMDRVMGPFEFNTNDEVGLLIEGFDTPPMIMMPHHKPYYKDLIEKQGYTKIKDLVAYIFRRDDKDLMNKLEKVLKRIKANAEWAMRNGFTMRPINLKNLKAEVERLKEIYNEAWSKNWGFVPFTDPEFDELAKGLKAIADPDLAPIVEYVRPDGTKEPAGFSLVLPDINPIVKKINGRLFPFGFIKLLLELPKIKRGRLLTLGVKHKFHKKGVDSLLYYQTFTQALKKGYEAVEASWILEDNMQMRKPIEFMGGKIYKVYRVFVKNL